MALPSDFQFSQNNLQDYIDCPRRFELRHLQRLQWPAPQTEPIIEQERHIQQQEELRRWRQQNDHRYQLSIQRRPQEPDREWRHRQWLEEQRLQRQREEIRRRQWWEHQRHEQEMRRREHELEWEWRHRQWLEQRRHEHELSQIEIVVLAMLLAI